MPGGQTKDGAGGVRGFCAVEARRAGLTDIILRCRLVAARHLIGEETGAAQTDYRPLTADGACGGGGL